MKIKVKEDGVLIPRRLLKGATEVEIREQENFLLILPVTDSDPIFELGSEPIQEDITDASVHHVFKP